MATFSIAAMAVQAFIPWFLPFCFSALSGVLWGIFSFLCQPPEKTPPLKSLVYVAKDGLACHQLPQDKDAVVAEKEIFITKPGRGFFDRCFNFNRKQDLQTASIELTNVC